MFERVLQEAWIAQPHREAAFILESKNGVVSRRTSSEDTVAHVANRQIA